jgi:putative DNA primase/helicase
MHAIQAVANDFGKSFDSSNNLNHSETTHTQILDKLLNEVKKIDFELLAFPQRVKLEQEIKAIFDNQKRTKEDSERMQRLQKKVDNLKLNEDHYLVLAIESIIKFAKENKWDLCKNQDFIYIYNGAYWKHIDKGDFQCFLGKAAEKMGVPKFKAKVFHFNEKLMKQFLHAAHLPTPEPNKDNVLINLLNGTFEITPDGTKLRPFNRKDFITYQLPFEYNPTAETPIFTKFLNRVLPDEERQRVLSEFMGYIFIKHGGKLKLDSALILHGGGANGKSVFYEILRAMLGIENVSTYSLQELTDSSGYYRAMIGNKLLNYASEISGKLEIDMFKKMVSGEQMTARLPYGKPMELNNYAKFVFNCNELPKDVEHTNAFFRRWIIIPFDVTIPKAEQDSELHTKIIDSELSGVFNWVLDGLNRLLIQKRFSVCEAAEQALEQYKTESNSVQMFLNAEFQLS